MVEHATLAGFGTPEDRAAKLDALMERASVSLVQCEYFRAAEQCRTALDRAHQMRDYERMARICLPLQEARRQIRQQACDAGEVFVLSRSTDAPDPLVPGCYLVQAPMIGAEGRGLADALLSSCRPAMVVTREPMTRDGLWPIVATGGVIVRTRVEPPGGVERTDAGVTKDRIVAAPEPAWFERASEALGDAAIAEAADSGPQRVDDLCMLLAAVPDHEKLHQRLMEACRALANADLRIAAED